MSANTTVIFVTFNSKDHIADALAAIKPAHDLGIIECVVVDNMSEDTTVATINQTHPWVHVISSGINLGYGRGLNLGIANSTTPYVLLMNPDAILSVPDLRVMVYFLEAHPKAAVVAPAILEGDKFQHAGGLLTASRMIASTLGVQRRCTRRCIIPGNDPFRADWLCGAIMLTRRQLIQEVGGFDTRFFLYFEETDLCRRLIGRGMELWAVGAAVAHHVGGASARTSTSQLDQGCISAHYFRSRFYYLVKHDGWALALVAEVLDWAKHVVRAITSLRLKADVKQSWYRLLQRPFLQMPQKVGR